MKSLQQQQAAMLTVMATTQTRSNENNTAVLKIIYISGCNKTHSARVSVEFSLEILYGFDKSV